jgi:2-haloacid dehalogenase
MPSSYLVFDVNGTLLDLSALDPLFLELTGDAHARRDWFDEVVKQMLISAATTVYHSFDDLATAAFTYVCARRGPISEEGKQQILDKLQELPAFADVQPGLERLEKLGYKLIAFTNGTLASARKQLTNAGIHKYFVSVHSADEMQRFKPSLDAYQMLAQKLEASVSELTMVASHAWDISGASWAGLQTAFIQREQPLSQIVPQPNYLTHDLRGLAEKLDAEKAA